METVLLLKAKDGGNCQVGSNTTEKQKVGAVMLRGTTSLQVPVQLAQNCRVIIRK